jgi:hypothetical protein
MYWKLVPYYHPPDSRNAISNCGIYGGRLLNGTVIYVDIVEVFKEYFEN